MRVLLISANKEVITMPAWSLGLACVGAATQAAGHEAQLLDVMGSPNPRSLIAGAIEGFLPDVIGISVRNIDDQNRESPRFLLDPVKKIISLCRALSRAPIVLGGAGYSLFPERALEYLGADMGIQGEGEKVFPRLLHRLRRGDSLMGLPGLYLRGEGLPRARQFARKLDRLPTPHPGMLPRDVSEIEGFWLPYQSRRGCPLDCSYCSTRTIEGRPIRKRTPELVVQELARWAQRGIQRVFFVDNAFNLPPSHALALCEHLAEARLEIGWRCILYPWKIDELLVEKMARAGCQEVSLGFESGNERILRRMNKRFRPAEVRRISKMLAEHGIRRTGFLLLGGPDETRESVEESLHFADSLNLEALKVTVGIRIYPDTPLAELARTEGVISWDDDLLHPRFYLARGLEEWLPRVVRKWAGDRPSWMT